MTLEDAISEINRAGSIQVENGKLKLRFPEPEQTRLQPAIEILRQNREAALQALKTAQLSEQETEKGLAVLNRTGTRLIVFAAGDEAVGIWSDLDGPGLRAAIRTLSLGDLPIVYLDSPKCPDVYRVRRVAGQPVPMSVLSAMEDIELAGGEGWRIRDTLLRAKRWRKV